MKTFTLIILATLCLTARLEVAGVAAAVD
jgi:hypothetical protein